jgi:hypothetical protein
MSRTTTNFLVDFVAFAALVLLGTTGAITRYVLPPGSGHFQTLWGIDRHDWGGVHFWIAVVFVIAMAVHLFLHWRWIVATTKGSPQSHSRLRITFACMVLLLIVGSAIAPFFSPVAESGEQPPHKGRAEETTSPAPHVNGSMTLAEIEQQTGVPADVILKELGLPPDTPTNERMGRLRKQYEFEMHKVQEIVEKQLKQHWNGRVPQ